MVLDGTFPPTCDDDDVLNPGADRLLHGILNQGLIDQWEHLFGGGFGGWKEAGSEASGWDDGLGDLRQCHNNRILRAVPRKVKLSAEVSIRPFSLYFP